jgi:hypothetical protein
VRNQTARMDSAAYFLPAERIGKLMVSAGSDVNQGSVPMTFVNKLSVLTAYLDFAFVAAIVLGVI